MTNQPPLNPDALEAGAKAMYEAMSLPGDWSWEKLRGDQAFYRDIAQSAVSAYLAVAQPVVNSFDPRELNRRGWTCGCEPGDYDECDDCLTAAHELANFLNRPEVKP